MKIARNLPVSGRHVEWYSPSPAPSLRELLSAAKLRECRPMVPLGRWFTRKPLLALKFLSFYVHRSTLPQSRIRSTAPSEREPGQHPPQCQSPARWMFCQRAGDFLGVLCGGYFYHSTRCLRNRGVRAIFIAPTNSEIFTFHRSTGPYYSGWAPWNSTWRGSICQWFWVMVSSFWESFSSRPGLRVMHSRVGPAPLRQKAAPVVRTRASMRE